MRSEATSYSLEDCLEALIDYRGKTPRKTDFGIPLVTAKVVKNGRIETPTEFIAAEDFEAWMTRGLPQVGDVVMTTEAPLGEIGQIQRLPIALAQRIVTLRGKRGLLHNDYLLYALQSEPVQEQLRGRASGTTVVGIKQSELRKVALELPPYQQQVEVASVMKALDGRIDLLRQTNTTLESIAQTLFKSWFIDFDPVRAKQAGSEPEGMDAATAALFPAEFEKSALGLIPKGWSAGPLSDLCARVVNGSTPSRGKEAFWGGGLISWYKTGELADGFLLKPSERITDAAVASTSVKVLPRHAILMAIYAAPTVGRLGILTENATFNQACTGMVSKPEIGPWFLFQTLFYGREWFNSRANGAAQQNISKAIVESFLCVRPQDKILTAFNGLADAVYNSIENNAKQAASLARLRDTLLPRLISGKLRLPDAQEQLEDALA